MENDNEYDCQSVFHGQLSFGAFLKTIWRFCVLILNQHQRKWLACF